ncbi:MAG: hypothetical protein ABI445_24180 [Polyangia bacterium]
MDLDITQLTLGELERALVTRGAIMKARIAMDGRFLVEVTTRETYGRGSYLGKSYSLLDAIKRACRAASVGERAMAAA